MSIVTMKDGTDIYYKDLGAGQPIVFSHGWPLSSDDWDAQMLYFGEHGYRCIAHDRRGHGRSSQPWNGNEMDTYADDLAELFKILDLGNAVMVGHSTGGGEVARYIGRHGTKRVAKAVLVDAVTPGLVKPGGLMIKLFDDMRAGVFDDMSQFWEDLSQPFFGANRPGANVPKGILDRFWLLSMQCGLAAAYYCIKAFSESDFTEDLAKFDVPTLIIHGDDDQIVPIDVGGNKAAKLLPDAAYHVYKGAPHGLMMTHQKQFNSDLLAFASEKAKSAAPGRRGSAEPASRAASSR